MVADPVPIPFCAAAAAAATSADTNTHPHSAKTAVYKVLAREGQQRTATGCRGGGGSPGPVDTADTADTNAQAQSLVCVLRTGKGVGRPTDCEVAQVVAKPCIRVSKLISLPELPAISYLSYASIERTPKNCMTREDFTVAGVPAAGVERQKRVGALHSTHGCWRRRRGGRDQGTGG